MKSNDFIPITDRFMFYKVFTSRPDLLKRFLEIILETEIDHIELPEGEKNFENSIASKAIRLDIYTKDDNTLYDVEMQTFFKPGLPERARYYQSMMDTETLSRGHFYGELKNSIVIFICTFDPFKKGLPIYDFSNRCKANPEIELNDRTRKLFLNLDACDKILDEEMKSLLQYFKSSQAGNSFTKNLDEVVRTYNSKSGREDSHMTLEYELVCERAEGKLVGIIEGKKAGLIEGRKTGLIEGAYQKALETAKKLIGYGLDTDKILDSTGISKEDYERLSRE